jgi:hypothetical protein
LEWARAERLATRSIMARMSSGACLCWIAVQYTRHYTHPQLPPVGPRVSLSLDAGAAALKNKIL